MNAFVIHRSISDDGVIEISQEQQIRSLYFGNDAKQSSMDLNHPAKLILSYTRAMMSCLLFCPTPQKILLIGLGGGSIGKFLLHHFPDSHIDAVEIRHDVVKLAHAYFELPQHPNLYIHVTDAYTFLANNLGRFSQYDLIVVDAFNHDGVSDSVKSSAFFLSCRQRMASKSIISINLWNGHSQRCAETISTMETLFSHNVLSLPVPDKGNLIVLAASEGDTLKLSTCKPKINALEQKLALEFGAMYRQLKRANRWRAVAKLFLRVNPGLR